MSKLMGLMWGDSKHTFRSNQPGLEKIDLGWNKLI